MAIRKRKARSTRSKSSTGENFLIDSAIVLSTLSKLKKLMGEPENVNLNLSKNTMEIHAVYKTGTVMLRDSNAIKKAGKSILCLINFSVLKKALHNRGEVEVSFRNNQFCIKGNNYKVELNVQRGEVFDKDHKSGELDVKALSQCINLMGDKLYLSDPINMTPVDVHFVWDKSGMNATVADSIHAMIIQGKKRFKTSGSITIPLSTAKQLVELGGDFNLTDVDVYATNDQSYLQMRRIDENVAVVSSSAIMSLLKTPVKWTIEVNAKDIITMFDAVSNVMGDAGVVELMLKDELLVNVKGQYGNINTGIDFAKIDGKIPKSVRINSGYFLDLLSKFNNTIVLSGSENNIRLEQADKNSKIPEWSATGFLALSAE